MSEEKVLVQVRVSPEAREVMRDAAGGPKKISGWLEAQLLGGSMGSSGGQGDDQIDEQTVLMLLLDEDVLKQTMARAKVREKKPSEIVNNALRRMFMEYPLDRPSQASEPGMSDRIVMDDPNCQHVWGEVEVAAGVTLRRCQNGGCKSKMLV